MLLNLVVCFLSGSVISVCDYVYAYFVLIDTFFVMI